MNQEAKPYILSKSPTALNFSENTIFYDELLITYQNKGGKLMPYVTTQDVTGDVAYFQRMETFKAVEYVPGGKVPMNNLEEAKLLLDDYAVGSTIDTLFEDQMKVPYRQELIKNLNFAITRKLDQLILDCLQDNIGQYPFVIDENVGGANTNLNVEKLGDAKLLLDDANVPLENRVAIIDVKSQHALMREEDVKNSLYNTDKVLKSGSIGHYYGTDLVSLSSMNNEEGLKKEGNIRNNFLIQKGAVGLAYSTRPTLEINKRENSFGHVIQIGFSAGVEILNDKGIVHIKTYEEEE